MLLGSMGNASAIYIRTHDAAEIGFAVIPSRARMKEKVEQSQWLRGGLRGGWWVPPNRIPASTLENAAPEVMAMYLST